MYIKTQYFALRICQTRNNEVTYKADSLQKLPIDLYFLDCLKAVLGGALRVIRLPPLSPGKPYTLHPTCWPHGRGNDKIIKKERLIISNQNPVQIYNLSEGIKRVWTFPLTDSLVSCPWVWRASAGHRDRWWSALHLGVRSLLNSLKKIECCIVSYKWKLLMEILTNLVLRLNYG